MFLSPDSVARSTFLKCHGIVSGQALPLKNRTHFCRPFHSCFRSNLLVYLEREQNTEHIFDQDHSGGIDQVRLGARRCGTKSTEKSQEHGSTEFGPPGGLEPHGNFAGIKPKRTEPSTWYQPSFAVMTFRPLIPSKCFALFVTRGTRCRVAQAAIHASLGAIARPSLCLCAMSRP